MENFNILMELFMKEAGNYLIVKKWNTAKAYLRYKDKTTPVLAANLMRACGRKIRCQVMEYIHMQMEHHIKANGKIASIMVEDNIFSLMAHPIKVNGKTI